jgi:CHAT domain-containing protein/tetratricopeptide (TPR) repeat protein
VRPHKYHPQCVIVMLFWACIVCFDRSLNVSSLARSNDADDIRSLIQKLFDSYQQKDLDRLITFWNEKSPFLAENIKALQREFSAYEKIVVKGFDIHQIKVDGDKATLRVVVDLALTRANMVKLAEKTEKKNRSVELTGEGGIWKVWKFISSEEELAAAIIAAKMEEEWKTLMEREPELITPDLVDALIRQNHPTSPGQGNYQRALAINQLAYKLAEQIGDQLVIANALMNTGYIYGWLGTPEVSPELALEYFQKSLKIAEECGFKDVMALSLIRSAILLKTLGELSQAAEYYQKSLKLFDELGNRERVSQVLNNLGNIHREKGNYVKALELLLKSLKMSENRLESGEDWQFLSDALINVGATFAYQGNHEQALAHTQRAVEAAEKATALKNIYAGRTKVIALINMGDLYLQEGNYSLAMDYFQKSMKQIEMFENTPLFRKDDLISVIKANIGDLLAAQKNTPQAIANYREALRLAEKSMDKIRVSDYCWSLSKISILQGDYREALALAERAVSAAQEIGQYPYAYRALVAAGKAYWGLGQLEEAHQSLAKAIDLTEQLREQSAGSEFDRQRYFEVNLTPYQAMIDFQVDQKRFTEAFSYTQRAKGRTLLELLQNGRTNITKSISTAEQIQEQQLIRKITSFNRQITSERLKAQPDEKRLAEFEAQLKKVRLEFEAFQTALYASYPELKVQRGDIRPVSFDDAANLISNSKTALLDFIVTEENVHLFVLTKDGAKPILHTYTIKIDRKSLTEKVERFRRRMENRDYDFQKLSHELYDFLIKPAQKQLQNKTNLIISPYNVLWDLPFQVLLSAENRYLIEDAAISYAPSLSVLREMQMVSKEKQPLTKASILALGNPALGTRSKELAKFAKMDAKLQPLPEAATQVRALGRLYGPKLSKVLTDSAAREELVKEQSAHYRILHLATHGILNDVSPMYSHVLLSQTSGRDDEDGLLEAWEMMNLDLNADLVVLAACETARGRAGAGEGVLGMNWALFVAGCPRTVVSQWKVEASSTTALMVEFHKRFKTRYGGPQPAVSIAEAMRQAALKVMRNPEYVHPFYWGGFVVVGDGN